MKDAGQAEDEFMCRPCNEEGEKVKAFRAPRKPSQKEVDDHELSHVPYRDWCEPCIRGQAKDAHHRTVTGELAESSVVRVSMDYCFVKEDVVEKDNEHEETTIARMAMTVLVMMDTLCSSIWSYAVKSKGMAEKWVAEQMAEDIETIGLSEERIILKADQEASITEVQRAVAKAREGYGTAIEQSKVGDSNTNGKIERAIQDLKGLVRTLRADLESKTGGKVHLDDPIVPWMVRHAGHLLTRCRVRENGRTAFQMMKGRRSNAKLVPFGEAVLFKIPKTQRKVGDFEDRWEMGVWVGFMMRSGEHLVGTAKGVFRVSTVMRRTADKRWSAELIKGIAGSPEEPVPGSSQGRRIPAFAKKFEDPAPDKAVYVPIQEPETEVRTAYIYKKDIDEHGPTDKCPGCRAVMGGGRYRARHTDECRKRFESLLSGSETGKKRYEAATERIMRQQDDRAERKKRKGGTEEHNNAENEPASESQPSRASVSGMAVEQRRQSVTEQNQREIDKAIRNSKEDHEMHGKEQPDERMQIDKSKVEAAPGESKRGNKRGSDEEADDSDRFGDRKFRSDDENRRGNKRAAEEEADDSPRFGDKKFREDVASMDHPGPINKSGKFKKGELEWKDIGSGVVAKTFPNASRMPSTSKGGPALMDVHRRIVRSLTTGKVVDDCVVDDTTDEVMHRFLRTPDDLRVELIMKGALRMFERKGPDVSEIFSQPRIAQEAAMREYSGVQLKPGWSLDLTRRDPMTNRPWDLSKHEVRERVRKLVRSTKPFMLIGSPPCTMFSSLQNLSKNRRDQKEYEKKLNVAKQHIKFCAELYKMQAKEGRFFLHEHPNAATSWGMKEVAEVMTLPGVQVTACDMCAYGMTLVDKHGEARPEKRTKLMSNSPEVIKRVSKQCTNKGKDASHEKHRHADLTGGYVKQCQVYPKAFCQAVCEGVAAQKKLYQLGMVAQPLMSFEEMMSAVPEECKTGDPSKDLHEDMDEYEDGGMVALDDQSGTPLKPSMVAKARREEIDYFKAMKVYEKVAIDECWLETGKAPIAVRWVDINKGDEARPNYRSRLVAKEYKNDVRPDLYAATPPSECLRLMISKLAENGAYKMLYADVSRAYFYAKAIRPVYVKLPDEDVEPGDEGKCGKLLMSMYGTRDAAQNWSMEYSATLVKDGYVQGKANPCLFWHPKRDISVMVHGDDFVAVGTESDLRSTRATLENKYKIKVETLGKGPGCKDEVRILNKIVRYTNEGVELEADPRHAELVIKELGLEGAKLSKVPGTKETKKKTKDDETEVAEVLYEDEIRSEEDEFVMAVSDSSMEAQREDGAENDEELEPMEARRYRAVAARLNYLAPDRVDIQFAVKEAARVMSKPRRSHWALLAKIGRYLIGRPRVIARFPWQSPRAIVTTFTDSDWAGCSRTSKSTSGGIVTAGEHTLKTYSRQQKVIALSSAEAELYAMVAASAETLAIIAYARDLGREMGGEVYTDSSAALGITLRSGIGKVRHLRTQGLWVQETRATGRLSYKKVLGSKNPADVLTKHVPAELLDRHLESIGVQIKSGRAITAPELNNVESLIEWYVEGKDGNDDGREGRGKRVRFAAKIKFRAIPSDNKGRPCKEARNEERKKRRRDGQVRGGVIPDEASELLKIFAMPSEHKQRWADMGDSEESPPRATRGPSPGQPGCAALRPRPPGCAALRPWS